MTKKAWFPGKAENPEFLNPGLKSRRIAGLAREVSRRAARGRF